VTFDLNLLSSTRRAALRALRSCACAAAHAAARPRRGGRRASRQGLPHGEAAGADRRRVNL